ncbi:MAG: metallophosphoesterase [Planctomycetota bacterium]
MSDALEAVDALPEIDAPVNPSLDGRPTLVISDMHLGSVGAPRAKSLRPLWQGVQRVVVNGDLAEIQTIKRRAEAAKEARRMVEMCDHDGVELITIPGNHDAYVSEQRYATAGEGQVLIMHGDALHPDIAPWSSGVKQIRQAKADMNYDTDANFDAEDPLDERIAASHHMAVAEFDRREVGGVADRLSVLLAPHRVFKVVRYWKQVPDLAGKFLDRYKPETKVLIFGHSHRQGVWRRGGRVLINTGSFSFPGRPRAVRLDQGVVSVFRIRKTKGEHRLSERPLMVHNTSETGVAPSGHTDVADALAAAAE